MPSPAQQYKYDIGIKNVGSLLLLKRLLEKARSNSRLNDVKWFSTPRIEEKVAQQQLRYGHLVANRKAYDVYDLRHIDTAHELRAHYLVGILLVHQSQFYLVLIVGDEIRSPIVLMLYKAILFHVSGV